MKLLFLLLFSPPGALFFYNTNVNPKVDAHLISRPTFDSTCPNVVITPGSNSIQVSGLSPAPIVGIQVFDNNWTSVFSQTYTSHGDAITVSPIANGQYFVQVRFFNNNWGSICSTGSNVTVSAGPPPDTCKHRFQKAIGYSGIDQEAIALVNAQGGGYIIAGQATLSGHTNYDGLVEKFDANGNVLWNRTVGGAQDDYFYTVAATADGGCIAGGAMNTNGFNTYVGDAWLVKIDGTGNIQWQKKYSDGSNPGRITKVIQTSDGGYAFVGDNPFTPGLADWMIIKTDASGNIQWQKKFGTSNSDDGTGIFEDNNGGAGLVVTGNHYSSTWFDADIVKFDLSTGALLWTKSYDLDNRTNRFGTIYKVADGFVINAVNHDGFGDDNAVFVLIKTDFSGNILFAKEVRVPTTSTKQDGRAIPLADGTYMCVIDELPEANNGNTHVVKLDASGNVQWAKKYPNANGDLQITYGLVADGNYVVGAGHHYIGLSKYTLLFKADLSGLMGSCQSTDETATVRTPVITPQNAPWTTNVAGNLSVSNTTGSSNSQNVIGISLCGDNCAPPLPTVSINNVTVNENAGNATLQVCLSATSTQAVTVQYATADGTANAGFDYTASSGTVTIPAGQTCANVSVPIINDAVPESTETFTVNLSSPTNATIGTGTGTVTINDDDQSQYDCNNVAVTPGNQSIAISGLTAPVITVQVFNSSWAGIFNQTYTNSPGTVTVNIGPGLYHVKVTFYTSGWSYICDKSQDVTVINQCPSGSICVTNTCPSQSVNLNNAYSISNLPPGTVVSWHTGTPATDANRMTDAQAQNVTTSGTYYAAINISGNNCYSNTIPVVVTINPCNSAVTGNSFQVKSASEMPSGKIAAYPNPFTHSVQVIIQSDKNERVTLVLTDMMGQQLQSKSIQLARGGNQVTLDGLDKFPSGSYFLKVNSSGGIQTLKLLRQQ